MTRAVSQTLKVSMQQAEEYKKVYGLEKTKLEGKVREALLPVFFTILDEIKKALHFYTTEYGGEPPKSIFLSGGTSYLPDIIPELTDELGLEVVLANTLSTLNASETITQALSNTAALYSISIGLAIREI